MCLFYGAWSIFQVLDFMLKHISCKCFKLTALSTNESACACAWSTEGSAWPHPCTPLHWSAYSGQKDICNLLLNAKGINVNAVNMRALCLWYAVMVYYVVLLNKAVLLYLYVLVHLFVDINLVSTGTWPTTKISQNQNYKIIWKKKVCAHIHIEESKNKEKILSAGSFRTLEQWPTTRRRMRSLCRMSPSLVCLNSTATKPV